jgi:exonuclease VII large subunit
MRNAGVGDLQMAFEALKQKLLTEGLFDRQGKGNSPNYRRKLAL